MKKVNLLPKHKQVELTHERIFYNVAVGVGIATAIFVIGVLAQLLVFLYLGSSSRSVTAQIEQLKATANKSENASIKKQIQLTNAQITDFSSLLNKSPQWSGVLVALIKHVPAGVKITQFDADAEKQEVTISGYSPTRDSVIDLYNNINADKENFKSINYPLENITQPTDVKFFFTFSLADGVLAKGSK